jgi:hypothetical protein
MIGTRGGARAAALDRLRQARGAVESIVGAGIGEAVAGRRVPQSGDHLELLGEPVEPLAEARAEVQPVGLVLGGEPPGAQPEFDPTARDVVHAGNREGEHRRVPEGRRGHQGAEADVRDLAGQCRQRDIGVRRAGEPRRRSHLQDVIGTEEGGEAALPGGLSDAEEGGMRGALLGFGEDSEVHAAQRID